MYPITFFSVYVFIYPFQVIKLYEQFCIPDLTVTLADTAISKADDDDPNLVIFFTWYHTTS